MHPGDSTFFQDSGEIQLETHVPVRDANGAVIPHVYRTTWAGPSFNTTGEFGIFGTIIAKVEDDYGNVVYHRGTVFQETFAKYAYFSNSEGGIYFGGGDQIFGPVHSNDVINIAASGVEFHDVVTTAKTIGGTSYGIFDRGVYAEGARGSACRPRACCPSSRGSRRSGHTVIIGDQVGGDGEATTRIEFVAIDLNSDGDASRTPMKGFMRVWRRTRARSPTRSTPSRRTPVRRNAAGSSRRRRAATTIAGRRIADGPGTCSSTTSPSHGAVAGRQGLLNSTAGIGRCYLGGDPMLDSTRRLRRAVPAVVRQGRVGSLPTRRRSAPERDSGATTASYLWPVNAVLNPDFKGVVFVDGKVAVSGVVRGRLTLASPYDIIIVDDVTLEDGAAADCRDFLGLFSGTERGHRRQSAQFTAVARHVAGHDLPRRVDAVGVRAGDRARARQLRGAELQHRRAAG